MNTTSNGIAQKKFKALEEVCRNKVSQTFVNVEALALDQIAQRFSQEHYDKGQNDKADNVNGASHAYSQHTAEEKHKQRAVENQSRKTVI